jgi:glycosyltransferase involved in cell wall biosynthesis
MINVAAAVPRSDPSWLLVAGGFHNQGGMDKLNAALARYLIRTGNDVHLVGFRIDDAFRAAADVHRVRKTGSSFFLGRAALDRKGCAIAAAVKARHLDTRVVTNGIGCGWPDVNWVHFVNHAWPPRAVGAPRWLRIKTAIERVTTLRLERRILPRAQLIIANSELTRRDLGKYLDLPEDRIATIYPGLDPGWTPAAPEQREAARAKLGLSGNLPTVAFVGGLGYDLRKGFDTLWTAWRELCRRDDWKAMLIVAGAGRALPRWQGAVARLNLNHRVKFLGFTADVLGLLAASDLLVSPVRYEPYGLNVHEAVACGVPAIVSAGAGIAERYPSSLRNTLLQNPEDPRELATRLLDWSRRPDQFRERFQQFGKVLRTHSADTMASQLVEVVRTHLHEKMLGNADFSHIIPAGH